MIKIKSLIYLIIILLGTYIIYKQQIQLKTLNLELFKIKFQQLEKQFEDERTKKWNEEFRTDLNFHTNQGFSSYSFDKVLNNEGNILSVSFDGNLINPMNIIKVNKDSEFNESYFIGVDSFISSLTGGAKDITIRPDDIWNRIVALISKYHYGEEKDEERIVKLNIQSSNISSLNEIDILNYGRGLISNETFELINPNFSTTTITDSLVILGQYLGTTTINNIQPYNNQFHQFNTIIPNVRLLGTPNDYVQIKNKLLSIINNNSGYYTGATGSYVLLNEWIDLKILPIIEEFIKSANTETGEELILSIDPKGTIPEITYTGFWSKMLNQFGKQEIKKGYIDGWLASFYVINDVDDSNSPYGKMTGWDLPTDLKTISLNLIDVTTNYNINANLFCGHLTADIINDYKFEPRLDWIILQELRGHLPQHHHFN